MKGALTLVMPHDSATPLSRHWFSAAIVVPLSFTPVCAGAQQFLPNMIYSSTVPKNGDVNPYGVAFVPPGFPTNGSKINPGDILVSNFNNSNNQQGTGTTII